MTVTPILYPALPYAPWRTPATDRLPGMTPVPLDAWLQVDALYTAQLAHRRSLIADRRATVVAEVSGARPAVDDLYHTVLDALAADPRFVFVGDTVRCPDGVSVALAPQDPLANLGRICQEDFCVLEQAEGAAEHSLTAAILCFPANWTLAEKIGHPLMRIHRPVPAYLRGGPRGLGPRVQRLFDALAPGRVLMRMNANWTDNPDMHSPRREADGHELANGAYMRIERQTLRRLPRTGAVVFGIHTCLVARENLTEEDLAGHARYAALQDPPGISAAPAAE